MPVPHHSVFTGRMAFLPPNQQRQSTDSTLNQPSFLKLFQVGWINKKSTLEMEFYIGCRSCHPTNSSKTLPTSPLLLFTVPVNRTYCTGPEISLKIVHTIHSSEYHHFQISCHKFPMTWFTTANRWQMVEWQDRAATVMNVIHRHYSLMSLLRVTDILFKWPSFLE